MPAARRSTRPTTPKVPCPECGSHRHVPIAYGYPSPELFEKERTGCVILGGCVVGDESPAYRCKDCGAEFG